MPYWAERLDKKDLLTLQASERGGAIRVKLKGDRVILNGEAKVFAKGELA